MHFNIDMRGIGGTALEPEGLYNDDGLAAGNLVQLLVSQFKLLLVVHHDASFLFLHSFIRA